LTVNICDNGALSVNEDAKALDEYIQSLEKQKVEHLTEKQVCSLIKAAKLLRTAIVQSKTY